MKNIILVLCLLALPFSAFGQIAQYGDLTDTYVRNANYDMWYKITGVRTNEFSQGPYYYPDFGFSEDQFTIWIGTAWTYADEDENGNVTGVNILTNVTTDGQGNYTLNWDSYPALPDTFTYNDIPTDSKLIYPPQYFSDGDSPYDTPPNDSLTAVKNQIGQGGSWSASSGAGPWSTSPTIGGGGGSGGGGTGGGTGVNPGLQALGTELNSNLDIAKTGLAISLGAGSLLLAAFAAVRKIKGVSNTVGGK